MRKNRHVNRFPDPQDNLQGNLLIYLLANLAISQTEVHYRSLVGSPAQPSLSPIIVPCKQPDTHPCRRFPR